jgi:hypothetical protein
MLSNEYRLTESHMLTKSSILWDATQFILVVCYRRFGISDPSHLKGPSKPRTASPLEMGTIGCPEMSVTTYQSTLCNILQQRRSLYIKTEFCTEYEFSISYALTSPDSIPGLIGRSYSATSSHLSFKSSQGDQYLLLISQMFLLHLIGGGDL